MTSEDNLHKQTEEFLAAKNFELNDYIIPAGTYHGYSRMHYIGDDHNNVSLLPPEFSIVLTHAQCLLIPGLEGQKDIHLKVDDAISTGDILVIC